MIRPYQDLAETFPVPISFRHETSFMPHTRSFELFAIRRKRYSNFTTEGSRQRFHAGEPASPHDFFGGFFGLRQEAFHLCDSQSLNLFKV
jgi:hypothetical protein